MSIPIIQAGNGMKVKISETLAPVTNPFASYVMEIFAEGEFVMYHLNKIHPVTGTHFQYVHYLEADRRLDALVASLLQEDGGKPQDETVYDQWLLEYTTKACAQCAKNAGQPYRNANVEKMLRRIDRAAKTVKNRSDKIVMN